MNKKIGIIIGVAVAVIAVAVLIITFLGDDYSSYESAHNKLFENGSLECDFVADIEFGNNDIKSTGNMKMIDEGGTVTFYYEGSIDGEDMIQFTDGEYIYQEKNGQKTKMKIGEQSEHGEKEAFSMEAIESELANLIDVSKIKEIQIMEKVDSRLVDEISSSSDGSGKKYDIDINSDITEKLIQSLVSEQLDEDSVLGKPTYDLDEFTYTAYEDSDGYLSEVNYYIEMEMTIPADLAGEDDDKVVSVVIDITMEAIDPGEDVDFDLPDTDDYK